MREELKRMLPITFTDSNGREWIRYRPDRKPMLSRFWSTYVATDSDIFESLAYLYHSSEEAEMPGTRTYPPTKADDELFAALVEWQKSKEVSR